MSKYITVIKYMNEYNVSREKRIEGKLQVNCTDGVTSFSTSLKPESSLFALPTKLFISSEAVEQQPVGDTDGQEEGN